MATRQIVLDTETTGLEPQKGHRIIEIGCIELVNRKITKQKFHTYINPEREVDVGASKVSGLSLKDLLDKPKFHEISKDFLCFIEGAELIIHNAPFDLGFINHELSLMKHAWGNVDGFVRVFDTLALARQLHPGQKNSLDALCKRYGVDNSHRNFHGALLDAEILAKVYLLMTAGQTLLTMTGETDTNRLVQTKRHSRPKVRRMPNTHLTVVKATEQELSLHEKRMRALTEKEAG